MEASNPQLTIALLAVPESTASTLYGMYDLLSAPGRDWEILTRGVPGRSKIRTLITSADGERLRTPSSLVVEPDCALADCPPPDVVAIPDLMVAPEDDIHGRYPRETVWLRALYAQGATLAAACSGALLLAETGLLDGQDATTHWGYCEAMQRRYPRVRIHPQRALVISGPEQRLILAGGGSSWQDLALFIVARYLGTEEAMQVARMNLLDWHHIGQQPFAALLRTRQTEDAVIARCQEWIASNYEHESPVAAMIRLSGLTERSFTRRFARATGMSPLEYVHTVRLEEAKQVLETRDIPVEAVAEEVGYGDASFFSRLFRRKVGLTPAQYRRRFGRLRKALDRSKQVGQPRTAGQDSAVASPPS